VNRRRERERLQQVAKDNRGRFDGKLAPADIDAQKSEAGGWTMATLAGWGINWPPERGWKRQLLRQEFRPRGGLTASSSDRAHPQRIGNQNQQQQPPADQEKATGDLPGIKGGVLPARVNRAADHRKAAQRPRGQSDSAVVVVAEFGDQAR
jgi:hypothetical protein